MTALLEYLNLFNYLSLVVYPEDFCITLQAKQIIWFRERVQYFRCWCLLASTITTAIINHQAEV